jgi:type IX secretion system PorP/SprF family membrane protein
MKKLFILLLLSLPLLSEAQHHPMFSQFFFNDFFVNPAVAGSRDWYDVRSNHRYQWVGLTDAPRTFTLSACGPNKKMNMGFGGSIFTDNVGPTRRTGFQFAYAYHLKINEDVKLSMGVSAGMLQFLIDGHKIVTHDPGDNVISNGLQWSMEFDAQFGLYMYHKKWYAGLVIPQLVHNKLYFFTTQVETGSSLLYHYNLHGGYKFDINDDFQIEPALMFKYVKPIPLQMDAMVRAIYQEQVWLGASYRTMDAFSIMAGYQYKNYLSIGYSYDITTSNIKNYSTGTHELMLGVRFVRRDMKKGDKQL